MKIVNLVEDTCGSNGCLYEHGLSFYIETKNHKLLVDTGASGMFIENSKKLGIDLSEVDILVLSHGHYDHCGGVMEFAKINTKAKIYIQKKAFGEYYNCGGENPRYIGIDKNIASLKNVLIIDGNINIDEELFLFTGVKGNILSPSGNKTLKEKTECGFLDDSFSHEQYLVINENGKSYLLSGCAHKGIVNILNEYTNLFNSYPDFVISGFHLMKKNGYTLDDDVLIKETALKLKEFNTVFYTCHCTEKYPYDIMKEILQDKLHWTHSGDKVF